MDQLAQLFTSFGVLVGIVFVFGLFLYGVLWPWLFIRAFRDLHAIRKAIEHTAYDRPRPTADVPAAAAPSVQLSAFGR